MIQGFLVIPCFAAESPVEPRDYFRVCGLTAIVLPLRKSEGLV